MAIKKLLGGKFSKYALPNLEIRLSEAMDAAIEDMAEAYEKALQRNVGIAGMSLAELAANDHPFAKRHGEHGAWVGTGLKEHWQILDQSGALARNIIVSVERDPSTGYKRAFVDLRVDEAVGEGGKTIPLSAVITVLVRGDNFMVGRDFIWNSYVEVFDELLEIGRRYFGNRQFVRNRPTIDGRRGESVGFGS